MISILCIININKKVDSYHSPKSLHWDLWLECNKNNEQDFTVSKDTVENRLLVDGQNSGIRQSLGDGGDNETARCVFTCRAQWGGAEARPPGELRSSVCTRSTPRARAPWLPVTSSGFCTRSRWSSQQLRRQQRGWLTDMRLRRRVGEAPWDCLLADLVTCRANLGTTRVKVWAPVSRPAGSQSFVAV